MFVLNIAILIVLVMLSVAFYTLMERKFISFSQGRKGPNKVTAGGVFQPISDAIKLITKEFVINQKSNCALYILAPAVNLVGSIFMWAIYPFSAEFSYMKMSCLFMVSCMAVNTVMLMIMSWSSNSNYAYIGMMRTISQLISYEINFLLILITIMNLTTHMAFQSMWSVQPYFPFVLFMAPMLSLWLITILAETNRTPFDFSEGESELVSGFNIEYGSSPFVFLFLAEYSSILMMSLITVMMFTGQIPLSYMFYIFYLVVALYFIWVRATFPRFRYDKLMKLNWTQILPMATFWLYISFSTKLYCAIQSKSMITSVDLTVINKVRYPLYT